MSHVWAVFGQDELQAFIGSATLDRLEAIVPALRGDSVEPEDVFRKATLCAIFDAFVGPDAMKRPAFRREFYNHLGQPKLDALCAVAGVSLTLPFAQRVDRLAGHGWSDPSFCRDAVAVLGLSSAFLPVEEKDYQPWVMIEAASRPLKPLKDYQYSVFTKAIDRVQANCARFVIQMPTGSGKTRTAMELVSSILNEAPDPHTTVVWLAHSSELCEQAYECFLDVWTHLGRHPLRLARAWGDAASLPYDAPGRAFVVAGFQKMHSLFQSEDPALAELRRRINTVIVDEAHRVLAPTFKDVTRALLGGQTRVVGLTATPGRSSVDATENEALAQFFFSDIVSIATDSASVIEYLRTRGVLADARYEPLITSTRVELTPAQVRAVGEYFDFPESVLRRLGGDDIRNLEILRRLQRECEAGGSILFFACSVEHSRFICANLVLLGLKAAHVDGGTSTGRRQRTIDEFRRGQLQVLCNYGVLSTGFDAPKVDVVFISRPTASIVLYSQMIGRGLRGPAIGGTRSCKIIDVRDNIVGYSDQERVYSYFDEYYNEGR